MGVLGGTTEKPHKDRTWSSHLSRSRCLCGFWRSHSRVPCDGHRACPRSRTHPAAEHTPCSSHTHPTHGWYLQGTAETWRDTGMGMCRPVALPGRQKAMERMSLLQSSWVGRGKTALLQAWTPQRERGDSPAAEGCVQLPRTHRNHVFLIPISSGAQGEKRKKMPLRSRAKTNRTSGSSESPAQLTLPGSNKVVIINSKKFQLLQRTKIKASAPASDPVEAGKAMCTATGLAQSQAVGLGGC